MTHFSIQESKRNLTNDAIDKFKKSFVHAATLNVSQYIGQNGNQALEFKKFKNRGYDICFEQT